MKEERRLYIIPFRLNISILTFSHTSYNLTWVVISNVCHRLDLKRTCEVAIFSFFFFFENKQGICACVVPNFHPGLKKMPIIWKIWTFHPGLKFYKGVYSLAEMKFQLGILGILTLIRWLLQLWRQAFRS